MTVDQLVQELGYKTNLTLVILAGALLLARILPVIVLSPFLGGEAIPNEVKIGFGLTLAIVLFPAVQPRIREIPITALPYVALLLKEVFIGVCLAFIVSLVFEAALMAGTMADMFAGTNMAQLLVPQIQQQVSLFSVLKMQIAVVLFLTLNGHHVVIEALADSLLTIPLDRFPTFPRGMWPFFEIMIRIFADLLKLGLLLSAPIFVATFTTDLALGMINRVAPQIQVFFISMQIKPVVAVLVVLLSMQMLMTRFTDEFTFMLRLLRDAIRLLG